MDISKNRVLHIIVVLVILLGIIAAAAGVFYSTGGKPFEVTNQYGDTVKMYGDGIYAHDSYFKAPIFRGTDFTILFLGVPLLIAALVLDMRKNTLRRRIFLISVISMAAYYSASISFGVTYNFLLLLYIALFSASFFGLITAMASINAGELEKSVKGKLPYKGVYIFLVFTGVALIVAWLPDILSALLANRSLAMIEVYTTEITYVLDMGIIAPLALVTLYLLKKRRGMGYMLLGMLLTVCLVMGVMLPVQTAFQYAAGIVLPVPVLITKNGSFCLLALFALYFNIRLFKAIEG